MAFLAVRDMTRRYYEAAAPEEVAPFFLFSKAPLNVYN